MSPKQRAGQESFMGNRVDKKMREQKLSQGLGGPGDRDPEGQDRGPWRVPEVPLSIPGWWPDETLAAWSSRPLSTAGVTVSLAPLWKHKQETRIG